MWRDYIWKVHCRNIEAVAEHLRVTAQRKGNGWALRSERNGIFIQWESRLLGYRTRLQVLSNGGKEKYVTHKLATSDWVLAKCMAVDER
jgi:hypothetical protein